jgi:hypothetical protein
MNWKFWQKKPKPEIHPVAQFVAGIVACMCDEGSPQREKLMTIHRTGIMPPDEDPPHPFEDAHYDCGDKD